jgi:hypothetical protein
LDSNGNPIYYRSAGGRYYNVITNYPTESSAEKSFLIKSEYTNIVGAILSSNLYWWFQQVITDCLNLKNYEILSFGFPDVNKICASKTKLENLYNDYLLEIETNASIRIASTRTNIETFKEYKIGKSKHLIDKIDDIIGPLYGLTIEEINFIKKYEINFRLQDE